MQGIWGVMQNGGNIYNRVSESCLYDLATEIPVSNCSTSSPLFGVDVVQGKCTNGGVCECKPGFTGRSDWINLDGRDCHISIPYILYVARLSTIGVTICILQATRLLRKVYHDSQPKDRHIKSLIRKPPFQIGLHVLNFSLAGLILSATKTISPETIMVDPKDNPVFFTYFFLVLNSEWCFLSLFVRSIVLSVTSGIHDQADREVIMIIQRVERITHGVPYLDMGARIASWIVPALIAGATNNTHVSTVSLVLYFLYALIKFSFYPYLWMSSVFFAAKLATKKASSRGSKSSGSTLDQKLLDFKNKMNFCIIACLVANGFNLHRHIFWLFQRPIFESSMIGTNILAMRGSFGIAYAILLEILYFGTVEKCLRLFRRARTSSTHRSTGTSTSTSTGSGIEATSNKPLPSFSQENPMHDDSKL